MKVKNFFADFVWNNVQVALTDDDNYSINGQPISWHVALDVLSAFDARDMQPDDAIVHRQVKDTLEEMGIAYI